MDFKKWLAELLEVVEDISRNRVGTDVKIAYLKDELVKAEQDTDKLDNPDGDENRPAGE